MKGLQLYHKINSLPEDLKKKVEDFVDSLKEKADLKKSKPQRSKIYGSGKHIINYVSEDFDEPLDEFNEYKK